MDPGVAHTGLCDRLVSCLFEGPVTPRGAIGTWGDPEATSTWESGGWSRAGGGRRS